MDSWLKDRRYILIFKQWHSGISRIRLIGGKLAVIKTEGGKKEKNSTRSVHFPPGHLTDHLIANTNSLSLLPLLRFCYSNEFILSRRK